MATTVTKSLAVMVTQLLGTGWSSGVRSGVATSCSPDCPSEEQAVTDCDLRFCLESLLEENVMTERKFAETENEHIYTELIDF